MYHKCRTAELTRKPILLFPNQSISHDKSSDRTGYLQDLKEIWAGSDLPRITKVHYPKLTW